MCSLPSLLSFVLLERRLLAFFYVHVVFGPYPARFIGMVVVVCFALELLSTKRVFFREI